MASAVKCDARWEKAFVEFTDKQLKASNVQEEFAHNVRFLSCADLAPAPCPTRVDLRDIPCFTIDCSSTQDMDDAVSIEKTPDGYLLGVHIADVASYVKPGSALDACAMSRGTSHYLPDRTIHMLPPVLSADLCSLNPDVDRDCLSVLVALGHDGAVTNYSICKSTIRSRVKGIYDEVNAILQGEADHAVVSKYTTVADQLPLMDDLSSALLKRRIAAGARVENEIMYHVSVVAGEVEITSNRKCVAERIIEEFMVLANGLVAEFLVTHNLPGIFRTQDARGDLAEYLNRASRHDSLALSRYVHFTSPIRRLSDLKVHQVLTAYMEGCTPEAAHYLFDDVIVAASNIALRRSRTAKSLSYACVKRCLMRYFELRPTERFSGTVCGKDRYGNPLVLVDQTGMRLALGIPVPEGARVSFRVCVLGKTMRGVDVAELDLAAA